MPLAVRVVLLRQLSRVDLARFGPKLAEALVTRSQQVRIRRSFVRRRTAAADEAVALYRRLVHDRPGRHQVGLARALVAQASVPDDRAMTSALAQGREAIGYVEDTTDRDGLAVLAAAQLMMAMHLQAEAPDDALTLAERAHRTLSLCTPLTTRERVDLARSRTVVGYCRATLGEPAEALAAREEAVEIFRRLPLWARLKYMPARLEAISGLADSLASHRRWAEALTLATGAREDLTFMSRLEPLRFRPTLGNLLFVIARSHLGLREQDAAVAAAEEAVGHYRWLAEHDPVRYQPRLVIALRTLAGALNALGLHEKAAWAAGEAETIESR
ncbi:hypothetical protein O7631_11685 [Micromonospora sp. WMMD967]|uniref:hypothetical protein n=1 Tax=Micromonospora sp. WMMD967 TaxID=3016101 RepID=UPI002416CA63|nr:hypothetical protein [Micromonospora sp. WMMD967]MDG4837177.1 hypothetical protein [Micromonospora sp. WMMD967]